MERNMHSMDMSVQEQLRSMRRCFESKLDIISDKLDAVLAAMSNCGIINQPTPSAALASTMCPNSTREGNSRLNSRL